MKIRVNSITIKNFKGIKDLTIDFFNRTNISAMNGKCKTTIADAFRWVLHNQNSLSETKFDIRPKDENGIDIDFIDIYVKLNMSIDEKISEIEKTQKQKWVKKRGEELQTFDGNINSYIVNTIPKSEAEFKKYMAELIDENVFKYVSNTNTFMSLKPADRRKTLFDLVADIGVDEIVANNEKLIPILADLREHDFEELKSRTKKAISEFKKSEIEIPTRIDEVSKAIVEVDYTDIEKELSELEKELSETVYQDSNEEMYAKVNAINVQFFETSNELKKIENALSDEKLMRLDDIGKDLAMAKEKVNNLNTSLRLKDSELQNDNNLLELKRKQITNLGQDLEKAKLLEFDNSKLICPVCQSEFAEDKKAEMIAKFEKNKSDQIAEINVNGSKLKKEIQELKQKITDIETDKANLEKELKEVSEVAEKKTKELDTVKAIDIEFTKDKDYAVLSDKLTKLSTDLAFAKTLISDTSAVKQEIEDRRKIISDKIKNANSILAGKKTIEDAKIRVDELKKELKEVAVKLAQQEKYMYLLEEFNKTKVELLSDTINKHFNYVKWQLFRPMVNGGLEECCEPMINGKPYTTALNSGHKILAELDIINALQKIYDCNVPVFLDNAERINSFNVPEMDCQLITLSVSEDEELKVREV